MSIVASKNPIAEENTFLLSREEIEHFALEGYVIKKNVLDPGLMAKAVDVMWNNMPDHIDRHDQSTWHGNVTDCDGSMSISARYGKVKLREEIWKDETINALVANNDHIFHMVEQLLGDGNVLRPDRVRGLYPIFPTPEHRKVPVQIQSHVDMPRLPFRVSVGAYLQRVPLHGGGLSVWPGSHRTFFYDLRYSTTPARLKTKQFRKHFSQLNKTEPVEITGEAGDVVLFHHCLMHAPGINALAGHVRQAVYCNYRTMDCEFDALNERPENIWEGWEGILALNSPAILKSINAPLNPLSGRRVVTGMALRVYMAKVRHRLLKALGS